MKVCSDCYAEKPLSDFYLHRGKAKAECKACTKARAKAWAGANPDKHAASARRWAKQNSERLRAAGRRWAAANRVRLVAKARAREADEMRAVPQWADADAIRAVYAVAAAWRRAGEDVHVDHIVPLRSRLVCGLHTPENLTVLPARVNAEKSNRRWPGMPAQTTAEATV